MNAQILEQTGESTRKQNLFEIGEELDQIFHAYDSMEGEAAEDFVKQALEAYFDQVNDNLNQKLDGYCGLIKTYEAKAKIRQDEAKRLQGLAQTDSNNAQRLKDRLKMFMEATGNQKLETAFHKMWTQNNGGKAPLVWVDIDGERIVTPPPVDTLPTEYVTVIPEQRVVDMEAIRSDLEGGIELDFAELGERGTHLRIK